VQDEIGVKKLAEFIRRWRAGAAGPTDEAGSGDGRQVMSRARDVIDVPPALIRFKLLGGTIRAFRTSDVPPDDWDLDRRPIDETSKYISVVLHFRDGVPWEATPIFRRYANRFAKGEVIRECRSVDEFKDVYRADMDRLYSSLKERGFLSHEERGMKKSDLPHVYVGHDGEIIFGSEGNHRLAIASVLGIDQIPCRVIRRHARWEAFRQKLAAAEGERRKAAASPDLAGHPDLQDILQKDR
jgi:hypothetical protein